MNDDSKFDKMNTKLDNIREDFGDLKSEIKLLILKLESHIDDDKELAKKLEPIHNEYIYDKENKKRFVDNVKRLSGISLLLGIAYKTFKMLNLL